MRIAGCIVLMVAAIPGVYYLLAIYSSTRYFRVVRSLRAGDKIEIRGFGSFRTRALRDRANGVGIRL